MAESMALSARLREELADWREAYRTAVDKYSSTFPTPLVFERIGLMEPVFTSDIYFVEITGPEGTPYAGLNFIVTVDVSDMDDSIPPTVCFQTPILSPKVTAPGTGTEVAKHKRLYDFDAPLMYYLYPILGAVMFNRALIDDQETCCQYDLTSQLRYAPIETCREISKFCAKHRSREVDEKTDELIDDDELDGEGVYYCSQMHNDEEYFSCVNAITESVEMVRECESVLTQMILDFFGGYNQYRGLRNFDTRSESMNEPGVKSPDDVRRDQLRSRSKSDQKIVQVRALNGTTFAIHVEEDYTIFDVKVLIREETGIHVDKQKLIHLLKQLKDHQTVKECGLIGSVVYLIILFYG